MGVVFHEAEQKLYSKTKAFKSLKLPDTEASLTTPTYIFPL